MPSFDPEIWRTRARQRFDNAAASSKPDALTKLLRDVAAVEMLETTVAWCRSKRMDVVFGKRYGGSCDREARRINVNGRLAPEEQLHVLLHECGHFLIGSRSPEQRYGHGHQEGDPQKRRTAGHRVDIVEEEIEAWHRGLKLAKRLKIPVDVGRYNQTRTGYIRTYLKWALRMKGYEGGLDVDEE